MTQFLRENTVFIAGLVFLVALIAGASMLQTAHGTASTVPGSTSMPQALSSAVDNGVGWHIITPVSTPTSTRVAATAAPKAQHRLYNEEQDDDN